MTAIVLVLDKSGSMTSVATDTIGGVNEFIKRERADDPNSDFTLVEFSNRVATTVKNRRIKNVDPLTLDSYRPGGMTALYDAIGEGIRVLDNIEDKRKILAIVTDGLENSSREYNLTMVKELLDNRQNKHEWLVLFLGADIDAFATGASLGISQDFTMQFGKGNVFNMFTTISDSSTRYKTSGRAAATFTEAERLRSA